MIDRYFIFIYQLRLMSNRQEVQHLFRKVGVVYLYA